MLILDIMPEEFDQLKPIFLAVVKMWKRRLSF
jgi:hypothetical protein